MSLCKFDGRKIKSWTTSLKVFKEEICSHMKILKAQWSEIGLFEELFLKECLRNLVPIELYWIYVGLVIFSGKDILNG